MDDHRNIIERHEPLWGCWSVDAFIGQGSHGAVYRIRREVMGHSHVAAVKVISIPTEAQLKEAHSMVGNDEACLRSYFEELAEQTVREINLLHQLVGHAHVLGYQDHLLVEHPGDLRWDIFIRMEYSESLTQYRRSHALSECDIVKIGIDLCKALEACSQKGILHRDIKEDNIFVGSDGVYKLGDFGVAREVQGTSTAGTILGTPQYMAPELSRGERYSETVDLYALGIVLYKLLNGGRLPFMPSSDAPVKYGDTQEALMKRLKGEALLPPNDASPELGAIIQKACAFDRADRFQNATEMKKALQELERPLSGRIPAKPAKAGQNQKWMTVLLGIVVCAALFFLSGDGYMRPEIPIGEDLRILSFDDYALESVIRKVVGKPQEPVLVSDVVSIKRLDLSDRGIHSLEALRHFSALETLILRQNIVSDLTPLSGLKALEHLDLTENRVCSLTGLETLTALRTLSLGTNKIQEIDVLENLTMLETLDLSENQIADAQPLNRLKSLKALNLHRNAMRDLSGFKDLQLLERLDIGENGLDSLEGVETFDRLQWLDCSGNHLSVLEPLAAMRDLEHLDASENDVESFDSLTTFLDLQYLDLSSNPLSLEKPLHKLKGLTYLDLSDIISADVKSIGQLTSLTSVKLDGQPVADIGGYKNLKALQHLSLNRCGLKSLEGIETLTKLETLSARENALSDLEGINLLKQLKAVDVSQNRLVSLEAIKGLVKLKQINISDNRFSDLSPLIGLSTLSALNASNNAIEDLNGLGGLKALKTLDLSRNEIRSIEALAELKQLNTIDLSENRIQNVHPLSELSLVRLYLNNNQIGNFEPLSHLTGLKSLTLDHNANPHYDVLSLLAPRLIEKDFE